MSVLIKGMEMPKRDATFLVHVNGDTIDLTPPRKYAEEYHREREIYKLIPVPDHGRLIDADALMETFRERKRPTLSDGADGSKERVRYLDYISTLQAIKDAPTIIPEERRDK